MTVEFNVWRSIVDGEPLLGIETESGLYVLGDQARVFADLTHLALSDADVHVEWGEQGQGLPNATDPDTLEDEGEYYINIEPISTTTTYEVQAIATADGWRAEGEVIDFDAEAIDWDDEDSVTAFFEAVDTQLEGSADVSVAQEGPDNEYVIEHESTPPVNEHTESFLLLDDYHVDAFDDLDVVAWHNGHSTHQFTIRVDGNVEYQTDEEEDLTWDTVTADLSGYAGQVDILIGLETVGTTTTSRTAYSFDYEFR